MNDAFAFFDLPRRPWLEPEPLKEEFHRRSARLHPDAGGEAGAFRDLNAAYQILRDPVSRLRHLLELEAPEELARQWPIPPGLADLFMRTGAARQQTEQLLVRQRAAGSPLAKALLAGECAAQTRQLAAILEAVEAASAQVTARLHSMEGAWKGALPELARCHAEASYLAKWGQQLRELALQIDLGR